MNRLAGLRFIASISGVMPALVAGIHVLAAKQGVDGRDKPGHDGVGSVQVELLQR
jgi:hypothetical protein